MRSLRRTHADPGSHRPARRDPRHPRLPGPELPRAAPHASYFPEADRSRPRLRGALVRRRARRRRMKRSSRPLPPRRSQPRPPPGLPRRGSCAAGSRTPLCSPLFDVAELRGPRPRRGGKPSVVPTSPREFTVPALSDVGKARSSYLSAEESLATNAYHLDSVRKGAKSAHISRLLRIALQLNKMGSGNLLSGV